MKKKKHKWRIGKIESQTKFTFTKYFPSEWLEKNIARDIWISGYRIFSDKKTIKFNEKILDFFEMRLVFLFGKFSFLDTKDAKIEFFPEGKFRFDQTKIKRSVSNEDFYLLIIIPFDKDNSTRNEVAIKNKIDIYLGLLILFFGKNIAHELIFENVYGISDSKVSATGGQCENPLFHPFPDLEEDKINKFLSADKFVFQKSNDDKNRFYLSLRWFKSANFDSGVDAFLKYWIALEIIAMPNTTDIRPINLILSKVYSLSLKDIQNKYYVGRLFGLRSNIVHDGKIVPIHQNLLKYIEAIYKDIFYYLSEIQFEKFTERILDERDFNFIDYMPK